MANLYNNFENRFSNKWFAADWSEVELKEEPEKTENLHKDINTLQAELAEIEEKIEGISLNQLRLSNLAKLYNS